MEHFSNTYQEDFLEDLIPHFNARGMDLTLERMTKAIKAMGNPCSEIPAIQVVGTNGKGSIASFIKSTLKVKGIKAGVTTSPHLINWCERIVINDQAITPEQLKLNLKILHMYYITQICLLEIVKQ